MGRAMVAGASLIDSPAGQRQLHSTNLRGPSLKHDDAARIIDRPRSEATEEALPEQQAA
jgi:hypothetical protein